MRKLRLIVFALAMILIACQNTKTHNDQKNTIDQTKEVSINDEILAIDILLGPDQKMLDRSKVYNDKMRENYPEGFALDQSHRPHITIIQAFVKKSDIKNIEADLRNIVRDMNLGSREITANGLYYIPYEDKGLAGITIDKNNLMDLHRKIIETVKPYMITNGTGSAFAPRPDGKEIMQATVDYVNAFVPNASGEKYNPHVTIGTAFEDYVKALLSKPFENFTFNVTSISIYQLGELGTAQVKLSTIEL